MTGHLYLVPNLLGLVPPATVLPERTIEIVRTLRRFVVENPKPARQFLKSLDIPVPLADLAIVALPSPLTADDCAALLEPARAGESIGVVSDAGCPGVADPGAGLVAVAHDLGIAVVPLVGPSALLLGLMASGLDGQSFCFHGYLPVPSGERETRLRRLDDDIARTGTTQLFIETPYRNDAMLDSILRACRPTTRLCVAVDLTLPTEHVASAPIARWRQRERALLGKRPALFLLGRAPLAEPSRREARERGATGRPRPASS